MIQEQPIREIGDKVGAKYVTFFNDSKERLHSAWVPKIQVDGEMLSIHDESTESGVKEAETRYQALKIARQVRDEAKVRLANKLSEEPIQ